MLRALGGGGLSEGFDFLDPNVGWGWYSMWNSWAGLVAGFVLLGFMSFGWQARELQTGDGI